jgi:hypothetical protein
MDSCQCSERLLLLELRFQALVRGLGWALMPHEFHVVKQALEDVKIPELPTKEPEK